MIHVVTKNGSAASAVRGRAGPGLRTGISLVALLAGAAAAAQTAPTADTIASGDQVPPPGSPAPADQQTAPDNMTVPGSRTGAVEGSETIVVTGVRRSLTLAQDIKRDADTVIDSISATDIGAFSDRSVAESLQRIAGVTVSRFASPTDTQHLTGDPGQVVVRGLTQVATRVNGRESFSVNPQRGLNFADISTELLSQVDVYKNQTADLIEGGIGGTVDLHTRVPFDQKGQLISVTASGAYETLAKSGDPDVSALYSNRWHTSIGEIGFLASGSYTETRTDSQNEQLGQTVKLDASYFGTPTNAYLPGGIYWRDAIYDRTRIGASAAAQWRSNDQRYELTVQYNLSDYTQVDNEQALTQAFTDGAYATAASARYACNTPACDLRYAPGGGYAYDYTGYYAPTPGTGPFQFNRTGQFVFGTPSDRASNYGGFADQPVLDANGNQVIQNGVPLFRTGPRNAAGQPLFSFIQPNSIPVLTNDIRSAQQTWTQGIFSRQHDQTQDLSAHFRAHPTERLTLDLDYQHIFANSYQEFRSSEYQTFSTITVDLRGKDPRFSINTLNPYNFNSSPGAAANPNNYIPRDNLDEYYDGSAYSNVIRGDGQYKFDTTWLDSLQFGGRYSDREQTYDASVYNWGSTYATWNSNAPQNAQLSTAAYNGLYTTTNRFSGYFNGALTTDSPFVFPNPAVLANRSVYEQRGVAAELANSPN
ncbi:MAG: TonB-dependent receptor plug domain-containing protein, partial [Sphingomonadaceae bacterium]|nr:TonB-dependent receptor plug domain-containing protein [Sphingomonadaceae bacterium]